jgi:hypothetical protein
MFLLSFSHKGKIQMEAFKLKKKRRRRRRRRRSSPGQGFLHAWP